MTKNERKAQAKPLTGKQKTRHTQLLNTQERGSLELIEKSQNTVRKLRHNQNIPHVILENVADDLSAEIIRLRRSLISERTHRERLAQGLIPKLRSKCSEVRNLRKKLYPESNGSRVSKRTLKKLAELFVKPSKNGVFAPHGHDIYVTDENIMDVPLSDIHPNHG